MLLPREEGMPAPPPPPDLVVHSSARHSKPAHRPQTGPARVVYRAVGRGAIATHIDARQRALTHNKARRLVSTCVDARRRVRWL